MLTLICGLPNAGKTTYASQYDQIVHLDNFTPHRRNGVTSFEKCNQCASNCEGDVCVEGVYVTARQRRELIEACKDKSPKICIWLDTPLEECLEREKNYRKRPLAIVHAHHNAFEPPTLEEGWDEIIIIKGEKQ